MNSYTKVWLRAINWYVLQGTDTNYFDLNYGSEPCDCKQRQEFVLAFYICICICVSDVKYKGSSWCRSRSLRLRLYSTCLPALFKSVESIKQNTSVVVIVTTVVLLSRDGDSEA